MSLRDTIRIAHTARCKLQLAADSPDRNLRFILGHAFTLDKLRLQIAQIEETSDSESDEAEVEAPTLSSRRGVSFTKSAGRPVSSPQRRKSPPPERRDSSSDDDSASDERASSSDGEDLSLQRYPSNSDQPPRMVDDDSSDEDVEEPISPPQTPPKEELLLLTQTEEDSNLADMYQRVAGCKCQTQKAPVPEKVWDIPQKPNAHGPRLALVQVPVTA